MEELNKYLPRPVSPENIAIYSACLVMAFKVLGDLGDLSFVSRMAMEPIGNQYAIYLIPMALAALACYGFWKFKAYALHSMAAAYAANAVLSIYFVGRVPVASIIFGVALCFSVNTQYDQLEGLSGKDLLKRKSVAKNPVQD